MPTARKASSLTIDSKAIAATMPSWRSLASMWRVPNRIANKASASAIHNAVSPRMGAVATSCGMTMSGYCNSTVKLVETALSCNEMYGMIPTTAITVTRPESRVDLP